MFPLSKSKTLVEVPFFNALTHNTTNWESLNFGFFSIASWVGAATVLELKKLGANNIRKCKLQPQYYQPVGPLFHQFLHFSCHPNIAVACGGNIIIVWKQKYYCPKKLDYYDLNGKLLPLKAFSNIQTRYQTHIFINFWMVLKKNENKK